MAAITSSFMFVVLDVAKLVSSVNKTAFLATGILNEYRFVVIYKY